MMSHGMKATLKATDDSMFEIPRDALCRDQPVFAVDRPRLGALPLRMRKLEEAHPSPSRITTAHLGPRNLAVRWIRGQDGETSGYEIEIR
jgi:hypothetical protein